jgi:hypothetical protein
MMLHWPNRTKPISSAICARRLGDCLFRNRISPVGERARRCILSLVFPLCRFPNNNTNLGLLVAPIVIGMSMAR